MMTLKAIDTEYRGHLFRSRLEARWAVFFDQLELKWEYEVEGYDLDGVWYLPDFKLKTPQGNTLWIEVKNSETITDPKFDLFVKHLNSAPYANDNDAAYHDYHEANHEPEWHRTYLVSGTPLQFIDTHFFCPRCFLPMLHFMTYKGDDLHEIPYHHQCDFETPCGGGNPFVKDGVRGAEYTPHKGSIFIEDKALRSFLVKVTKAAETAQKARFEHGANG